MAAARSGAFAAGGGVELWSIPGISEDSGVGVSAYAAGAGLTGVAAMAPAVTSPIPSANAQRATRETRIFRPFATAVPRASARHTSHDDGAATPVQQIGRDLNG